MRSWRNRSRDVALGCALSLFPLASSNAADTATPNGNDAAAQAAAARPVQVVRERYPNRNIKVERHVGQDDAFNFVNHGPWTMWSPSGNVIAKGEYIYGKRQGDWIRWFAQADVAESLDSEGDTTKGDSFTEKKADPLAGTEFEGFKPPIASKAKFTEDLITGPWSVTDAEGRNLFQVHLAKNVPNGKATWWHANGQKSREIDFKNGIVDGQWLEWSAEGQLTRDDRYIDGSRLAEVTLTSESGSKTAEGVYLYARENVKVDLDWWSGLMEVSSSLGEGKALKQGKWQFYHEDGAKRYEAEYLDDKPINLHVWWFANGQKECEGRYEDGKPVGVWYYWHANGIQAAQGEYQGGNKVGRWLRWNEDGKVVENKSYVAKGSSTVIRHATPAPVARPAATARPIRNASLPAAVPATPAKPAEPKAPPPPSSASNESQASDIHPVSATAPVASGSSAKTACRECATQR